MTELHNFLGVTLDPSEALGSVDQYNRANSTESVPPPRSEVVCGSCFMAYNGALNQCPSCESKKVA